MSNYDYDLGILGGGAAGLTAASGAARFGAKTLLIEKAPTLGGDCLHYGCVPSKTLIRTANVYSLLKRSKEFGLPEVQLPPVDLGAVMDRVKSVIDKIQIHDSAEHLCDVGAKVVFGNAAFIDDHTISMNGQKITAGSWIIATGSSPSAPPVEGISAVPYWTNETIFQQRKLPAHLIVLGGGPIGLELSQSFARLGSHVTIVEFMDQILGPEDVDLAAIIEKRLKDEGITILKGTQALKAEYLDATFRLTVAAQAGKGQQSVLQADALLVAAGRKPNIDGLALEAAGVKFSPRGIPTNARMKTNISHIYACGDVNGQLPFTHVAGYEAGIALSNAVLRLPRKADYGKIGWCTYTDPEVASIGLNEKRAKKDGIEYRLWEEPFADNDRAQAEAETTGKIKLLVSPEGKLLGCQIVGAHAGELIAEWVAVINGGVKLSTLATSVHVYPTLAEISKRVSGKIFAEKIFSDRTKNIIKFLFSLKGRACKLPDNKN
jgi:pyruvate/2-oxoglutarate dehydrogenase complex dihydrolipoamide dehydrogenase (E3) component